MPSAEVSSPNCPREVSSRRMASGPSRGPLPGWCDLPERLEHPEFIEHHVRDLLGGVDGVAENLKDQTLPSVASAHWREQSVFAALEFLHIACSFGAHSPPRRPRILFPAM